MDVQMPSMDGLETTRRLRADPTLPRVPVLGLSANAFDEDRAEGLAAGMNDFLPKPADPRELHARLARLLGRTAVAPAAPAQPSALDLRHLITQLSLDEAGASRFVVRYLHTLNSTREELATAAERVDLTALAALAHRLKSSSAMVGANPLAALCKSLEAAALRGERGEAATQAQRTLVEIARVRAEAEAMVSAVAATRTPGSP
jgi:CheY-like chemotaxis protein